MTAHLIYGPPGAGKDMYMAWLAYKRVPAGYRKFADYTLNGAILITSYADMLVKTAFGRSYWFCSEIGARFNKRAWADLDPVDLAAVSQHRKGDLMLFWNSQHPRDVDSSLCARIEWYIRVSRLGPRGDGAVSLGDEAPGLFRRPWAFIARWYDKGQFTQEWELKPGQEAHRVDRFLYSRAVAHSYVTNEYILPDDLLSRVRDQAVGAEVRANLPRMVVKGGRAVAVTLPDGLRATLRVPRQQKGGGDKGGRGAASGAPRRPVATLDDPDLRQALRMRGLYVAEELDEAGEPLVDMFGEPLPDVQMLLEAAGLAVEGEVIG